jgi:putative membrane protein
VSKLEKPPERPDDSRPSSAFPEVRLSSTAARLHKPAFILFLTAYATFFAFLLLRMSSESAVRWVEATFLVLGTVTTLVGLARRLPLQSVLTAGMLAACVAGVILAIGAVSGVPFGPIFYSRRLGEKIFDVVPWPLPLLWVMLILNGRGVARLIMRPWRKTNYYGFWVMGLTCGLIVLFDLSFEPFGTYVKEWWVWRTHGPALSWYRAPWINFLGWFMTSLAVLIFTMPWLINKRPIKQPIDYHPLLLWLLLNVGLVAVNLANGLLAAAIVGLIANTVAAVYAVRGARW